MIRGKKPEERSRDAAVSRICHEERGRKTSPMTTRRREEEKKKVRVNVHVEQEQK